MRYRTLGPSGLRVSTLFLGAMTFAENFAHGAGLAEARRIIDAYADAGGNVVDTAVNYRGGASEEILGELLQGRRDRFVLCTKYGVSRDPADPNAAGSHRKNLRLSLETSLRRLRTDHIDVYYVHLWDPRTGLEETMRALDDAVRTGKILHLGISDTPAWVIAQANTDAAWRGRSPFVVLQTRYSLLSREAERDLIPAAEALGMTVAAWSPLGGGVLSGKFTRASGADEPPASPSTRSATATSPLLVPRPTSPTSSAPPPAQIALAWTMTHFRTVHPILGARRLDQLHDTLAAADRTLPPDVVATLDEVTAFDPGFPHDFIRDMQTVVFGEAGNLVDP
jgi:aryl-alcohol dehydrogenase-like predicted oxidoreductase